MRLVNSLKELRQHHPWMALGIALAIFLVAFLLRFGMGDVMKDVPFITLFPAIVLAALVGGLEVGLVIAALSGLVGWYFFLPPEYSFQLEWPSGPFSMILFTVTAAIMLYVIRTLNLAVDQLSAERDQSAVLFQELQHRVANNLQFVSSLLRLHRQTDSATDTQALEAAQSRLELMARIHRRLYDPHALRMPLGEYFEGLCGEILEATGAKNVVCVVEVPPVTFDLRRLMILSLLLNEIVTNSVKHAFVDGQRGTVSIRLEQDASGYAMTIKDDGRGLAPSYDTSKGFGFNIVQNLAGQISGVVTFSGKDGMTTSVVFPATS
jgi:two-component sensor histidine kinase